MNNNKKFWRDIKNMGAETINAKAFEEGYKEGRKWRFKRDGSAKPLEENPYPSNTINHQIWGDGRAAANKG